MIAVPYLLLALVALGIWVTQRWGFLALALYLLLLAVVQFIIKVAVFSQQNESGKADESDTTE